MMQSYFIRILRGAYQNKYYMSQLKINSNSYLLWIFTYMARIVGIYFVFQENSAKNVLSITSQRNCRNKQAGPSLHQARQEAGVIPLLRTDLLPELSAATHLSFPRKRERGKAGKRERGKEGCFICLCVIFLVYLLLSLQDQS